MKLLIIGLLTISTLSKSSCGKQKGAATGCYKGRLEVKGMCINYTIKVVDGNIDQSLIVDNWKDESSGKTHTNVFALKSRCTFPATINEDDTFYFTIDNTAKGDCAVCMAYYPVPEKGLSIKVLPGACQ